VLDVEAWAVWAVQGGGLAHVEGARGALLRAAVDAHGGAWCAQVHPWTVGEARAALWATLPPVLRALDPAPCDLDALPLAQALGQDWARRHVEGGGGLVVRQVRGPSGLVGVACDEACAGLDEAALQARLWPAWAARRQDVGGALRQAVEALQGRPLTWGALVEVAGGSRPTWRRRLVEAGLPTVLDEAWGVVKLNAILGVQVLATAPKSIAEPMRAPEHLNKEPEQTPPDVASEHVTSRADGVHNASLPQDGIPLPQPRESHTFRHFMDRPWGPVDVWGVADILPTSDPRARLGLWRLRSGVPGPWGVGEVVRAVGLCHVLRARGVGGSKDLNRHTENRPS
jgi:hypothetical protein